MKKLLTSALFLGALCLGGEALGQCPGIDSQVGIRPLGFQQLTVSTTAVALTLPTVGQSRMAVIVVETNTIRYRDDGTNPTASVGIPVIAGQALVLCGPSVASFRAIRASADATLEVLFYGN